MFGGRYLESKMHYDKKIESKLFVNKEYIRYKIPIINENIFSLLKILFGFLLIGNMIMFISFYKINKKKKHRELNPLLE